MVSVRSWIAAGMASVLAVSAAGAQEVRRERVEIRGDNRAGAVTEVRRISTVVGGSVRLSGGATVGKIEDIVINENGCIDYVVVFAGEKFYPVPWSVVTVDYGQRFITLDITRERFLTAPSFARAAWPAFDATFTQRVNTFFGVRGARREGALDVGRERITERPGDAAERRPGEQPRERPRDPAAERRPGERDPAAERRPGEQPRERDITPERKPGEREPAKTPPSGTDPTRRPADAPKAPPPAKEKENPPKDKP